jgi:hypothetical protein
MIDDLYAAPSQRVDTMLARHLYDAPSHRVDTILILILYAAPSHVVRGIAAKDCAVFAVRYITGYNIR